MVYFYILIKFFLQSFSPINYHLRHNLLHLFIHTYTCIHVFTNTTFNLHSSSFSYHNHPLLIINIHNQSYVIPHLSCRCCLILWILNKNIMKQYMLVQFNQKWKEVGIIHPCWCKKIRDHKKYTTTQPDRSHQKNDDFHIVFLTVKYTTSNTILTTQLIIYFSFHHCQ